MKRLAALLLIPPLVAGWIHGSANFSNGGGLLMNMSGGGYGPSASTHNAPLLNWAQDYGPPTVNLVAGGTQSVAVTFANGQFDATTGELSNANSNLSLIGSIDRLIWNAGLEGAFLPQWWNGLQFTISWTGTTVVTQPGSVYGTGGNFNSGGACTSSPCTLTLGTNPDGVYLHFTIPNVSDPPKNIKIYKTKWAANVARGEKWDPDFIAAVAPYGRLRTLDWQGTLNAGQVNLNQFADFNYTTCLIGCQFLGMAATTSAKIDNNGGGGAGNTLTVVNATTSGGWKVGMYVAGTGITGTPVITGDSATNSGACSPACTGTGSGGTYAVNGAAQFVAGGTAMIGASTAGSAFGTGTKGGAHPSVMVDLARKTGADIYYVLPVTISDQGMTDIATYFRDNLPSKNKVIFEYGNENWNGSACCTSAWTGVSGYSLHNDTVHPMEYTGYRAAALMSIVKGVYGTPSYNSFAGHTTSRWMGALGGEVDAATVTIGSSVTGFNDWCTATSCTVALTDLFGEAEVAPYWTDSPVDVAITGATATGATTTLTATNTFSNGQVLKLYFSDIAGGHLGSVLNGQYITISSRTASDFTFSTINTTGLTYAGSNNYTSNGPFNHMIDDSIACNSASTATATGTLSGTGLTLSGISGSVVAGMGVTGTGIPANTYINTVGPYTVNNSGTAGPTAVTLSPCATKYQFFAQQYSKTFATGSANDYGYNVTLPITLFAGSSQLPTDALVSNSNGLALGEYEGGFQSFFSPNNTSPNPDNNLIDFIQRSKSVV